MVGKKKICLFFSVIFITLQLTVGSAASSTAPATAITDGDGSGGSTMQTLSSAAAVAMPSTSSSGGGGGGGNPVLQLVGYVKDSLVRTVDGCGLLWKNHGRCNEIRSKQREYRESVQKKWEMEGRMTRDEMKEKLKSINGGITYSEYVFLVKGKEDRGKLMNVAFLMWGAPRFLPYALMFYPEMLPSPFAPLSDGSARESGLEKLSRERSHAVLQTLLNLERDAKTVPALSKLNIFGRKAQERQMDDMQTMGERAAEAMMTPGAQGSVGAQVLLKKLDRHLYSTTEHSRGQKRLVEVPKSIMRGVILAADGPSPLVPFYPNFLNRGKVISHIKTISESDEFLVNESVDLSTIDSTHLAEACSERFLGGQGRSDEELRESLGTWLNMTVVQPTVRVQQTGHFYNSNLARLSLLCYNALDSSRDERSASYLPRVLFQGQLLANSHGGNMLINNNCADSKAKAKKSK